MESLTTHNSPCSALKKPQQTWEIAHQVPWLTTLKHWGVYHVFFPCFLFRETSPHLPYPATVASGDEGFISIACSLGSLPNKIDGSSHVSGKPSREAVVGKQQVLPPRRFSLLTRLVFKCWKGDGIFLSKMWCCAKIVVIYHPENEHDNGNTSIWVDVMYLLL